MSTPTSTAPRTNSERLADWRAKNPAAIAQLAEQFRLARGIPPSPQSPITLGLLAQDVDAVLHIVFKVPEDEA